MKPPHLTGVIIQPLALRVVTTKKEEPGRLSPRSSFFIPLC